MVVVLTSTIWRLINGLEHKHIRKDIKVKSRNIFSENQVWYVYPGGGTHDQSHIGMCEQKNEGKGTKIDGKHAPRFQK